jgi:hypothetical protein
MMTVFQQFSNKGGELFAILLQTPAEQSTTQEGSSVVKGMVVQEFCL